MSNFAILKACVYKMKSDGPMSGLIWFYGAMKAMAYFIGAFRQDLVEDCKLLKDIKLMLNVLCINNLKCCHKCKCNDPPSITHILFGCVLITNTRGQMWSTVENIMPPAMITSVDSMSQKEKVVFIYKYLNGPPIKEWLSVDRALCGMWW